MNLPEGWPTDEMVDKALIVLRDLAYIPLEDGRRLVNRMIRAAIAAAPTPPAQEDEPVGFLDTFYDRFVKHDDIVTSSEGRHIPLYTRPDDKLRKVVLEVIEYADNNSMNRWEVTELINKLRAALEK